MGDAGVWASPGRSRARDYRTGFVRTTTRRVPNLKGEILAQMSFVGQRASVGLSCGGCMCLLEERGRGSSTDWMGNVLIKQRQWCQVVRIVVRTRRGFFFDLAVVVEF